MIGGHGVFVSFLVKKSWTVCVCDALCNPQVASDSKSLSTVITAVNEIKAQAVNSRLFEELSSGSDIKSLNICCCIPKLNGLQREGAYEVSITI